MSNYKFCFLFGPGSCGINLFLSLLDHNREVLAFPFTMKLYSLFDKDTYKNNTKYFIKIIEDRTRFKYLKNGLIDPSLSIKEDCSQYNHDIFCKEFERLTFQKKTILRKELIEYIYLSYAAAIKKELSNIKYFLIDGTYRDFLDEINSDFKKYKSFFLLRDPREQLLSLLKLHHSRNHSLYIRKKNYLTHTILRQKENYNLLEKLQNQNYEHQLIKFEDLKKDPIKTIWNVANFLNINFSEELKKPTLFGNLRAFESSFSNKSISGMGEDNTNRLKKHFNKYQIIQSEFIFSYYIKKFNYLPIKYGKNLLTKILIFVQPFKYEILPSLDIFRRDQDLKGYKNNFFYKLSKFIFFFSQNIFYYFFHRYINLSYIKIFSKQK